VVQLSTGGVVNFTPTLTMVSISLDLTHPETRMSASRLSTVSLSYFQTNYDDGMMVSDFPIPGKG
jgi:hypothetical protein